MSASNTFLYGRNKKPAAVSDSGNISVQETFKLLKSPPRIRLVSARGGVSLPNVPCGGVKITNPVGNNVIYFGGIGDDAPYINLNYTGDNKGMPIYAGETVYVPVENANLVRVVGTDQQDIYIMPLLNQQEDVPMDYTPIPAPDFVAPTVSSVFPANGATAVATNTDIYVIFSEVVDPATITSTSFTISPSVASNVSMDTLDATKAHRTLTTSLAFSTVYSCSITTAVKDPTGNALASTFNWSFTSAAAPPPPDTTPPTITSKTPASGATAIALNTTIVIVFSESMLSSTINSTNFILLDNVGSTVACSVSLGGDQKTVTVTPNTSLNFSTTYTAKVTTGAKDLAGNSIAALTQWTFTTLASSYTIFYNYGGGTSGADVSDTHFGGGLKQIDTLTTTDSLFGKIPKKVVVELKKVGTPAAGTIYCRIRNYTSPSTIKQELGSVSTSVLTSTAWLTITFENAAATYAMQQNDCINIEYTLGTASNGFQIHRINTDVWAHGAYVRYESDGTFANVSGYDLVAIIYG